MTDKKEISSRGIAQQSGLDVFSSVTTYNGEYLNWNYGNTGALTSTTDYATTAADPHTDALINSPANDIGRWYRYHTSGSPYTSVSAPISSKGGYIFYGQKTGGLQSYSGFYQKLSLIKGNEYQVEIQTVIDSNDGFFYIITYRPNGDSFTQTSSNFVKYTGSGITNTTTGIITSTFTAKTANDIIQFYYTTDNASARQFAITNISIKEKQEFLVPIYANDKYGNNHKILRRNTTQTVSND